MAFIRRHWRGILFSGLLAVPLAAGGLVYWSAEEIASPPRRALMAYHREFLIAPAEHGISITSFALEDGTSSLKIPTLLAHGKADHAVPMASGKRLFEAFPEPKRWIEIPGAGHDNVLVTDFPIYAGIAAWFLTHTENGDPTASLVPTL